MNIVRMGAQLALRRDPVKDARAKLDVKRQENRNRDRMRDILELRVYYEDTDFSGRVYHASYLKFLERGRTEWLRARGLEHRELSNSANVIFAVRGLEIEYLAPASMDDLLTVVTTLAGARGAVVEFNQKNTSRRQDSRRGAGPRRRLARR